MPIYFYEFPIGRLYIEEEAGKVIYVGNSIKSLIGKELEETELILLTKTELDEYFLGKRTEFTIPILMKGSEFMLSVWKELQKIPYGATTTYGEIAKKIGNRRASRSVGMACGANDIMIIVPCHRVIGKNKKLTGFSGGLDIKEKLLKLENNRDFIK